MKTAIKAAAAIIGAIMIVTITPFFLTFMYAFAKAL